MRLNAKLSILFVVLTVVPVFVVGTLSYQNGRRSIQDNTINHLASVNLLKKAELERWVKDNARTLEMLADMPFFKHDFPAMLMAHEDNNPAHLMVHQQILGFLTPTVDSGSFWELFIMRAVDGQVLLSTIDRQTGKFFDDQPYFIEGRTRTFIQNVYYAMSIQQPAMTISTPLVDAGGKTIAVLAGRLDLSELSAIMEKRTGLSQSEDTYLVNKFNFYVTEPHFGSGYALKKSIHTQGVMAALAQNDGVGFYLNYRGVPVVGAYQWLAAYEMGLITEVDQAEAFAPVLSLRKIILSIALSVSLCAAGMGWIGAYTVTTRLRRLVETAEQIGSDRLDIALDTRGRDEVADLANAFARMIKRLSSTLVSRDALLTEIEERKKAEALREQALVDLKRSNEELQQFAYVASHDLQEPLRMVSSYTQLLADRYKGQLDDKANKFIHYAVDGAMRMQQLIQDLLSYSRVTTQGGDMTPIDSQTALHNAISNLEVAIAESGADVSHGSLPRVVADATQLTQVFQNLIGNGIKFRSNIAPRVHISATRVDGYWQFEVADNGIGIEAEYQEKIFVIFQRLHTRREYEGTGIGLAICRRIIQRHGGELWVSSQPGQGAIFHFTLKTA